VLALLGHVADPYSVRQIAARRISAASARVKDIDVIMDLMVHDIDVVMALVQQPVTGISALGNADHAKALLTFRDGATAALTASRTEPGRIRDLTVTLDAGVLEMDYIGRTLKEVGNENGRSLPVPMHDALTAQLSSFMAAVRGDRVTVSALEAMAVMDVAWRVQTALGLKP
jgi:predicted dehydrogenase